MDCLGNLLCVARGGDKNECIINHWVFLIERLNQREAILRSVGETAELLADGRGTMNKPQVLTPLKLPQGYEVDVDVAVPDLLPKKSAGWQNVLSGFTNDPR